MSKPTTYRFVYDEDKQHFDIFINGIWEDTVGEGAPANRYADRLTRYHGHRDEPIYIIWD